MSCVQWLLHWQQRSSAAQARGNDPHDLAQCRRVYFTRQRHPLYLGTIARPDACQTCFMCELYCPVDALYVSPLADRHETVDEAALSTQTLGSFSRQMGWSRAKPAGSELDPTFRFRALTNG